jgi:hypothetical protein
VEHGHHAGFGPQVFWVFGKSPDGMPTGCKQCTIDLLGIFWQHFIELVWQSKDKVIVWHGQEFAFPVTDPPFTVGSLALGAVAVPAGIITNRKDATGLANSNMAAQGFGPAKGQSPEGFSYLYDRLVLLSERCTVNADDIANFIPGLQGLYSLSNGLCTREGCNLATCR